MASTSTCINLNCENGEWGGGGRVRKLKLIWMCNTCNCTFSLVISVIKVHRSNSRRYILMWFWSVVSLFTFITWCFQRERSLQFSGKDYHQEFSGDGIVTSKNKKLKTEFQSQKIKTEVPSQPQQNRPLGQYPYLNVMISRFWIKLMHFYSKRNYPVHVHKVFTFAAKVIIISVIIKEL